MHTHTRTDRRISSSLEIPRIRTRTHTVIGPALSTNNCGEQDDFAVKFVLQCKGDACDAQTVALVSAAFIVGAMIANISGSYVARIVGVRRLLVWAGIILITGEVGNYFATDLVAFSAWRAIVGVGIGFISWGVPFFLSEYAPPDSRGLAMNYFPLAIVGAIFVVYLIGLGLSYSLCNETTLQWRILYVYGSIVPTVIYLISTTYEYAVAHSCGSSRSVAFSQERDGFGGQESWDSDDESRERDAMRRESVLSVSRENERDPMNIPFVSEDFMHSSSSAQQEQQQRRASSSRDLDASVDETGARSWIVFAVGIAACQQLTGVNAIISYTPGIFKAAGTSSPLLAAVLSNGTNVLCTFFSGIIVDRIGRRPLLLGSLIAMTTSLLVVSLFLLLIDISSGVFSSILSIVLVPMLLMTYIAGFALGPGPLFYLICAETFPADVRDRAMAFSNFCLWTFNLVTVTSFPFLFENLGESGTFLLCGSVSVGCCVFAYASVSETKGCQFLPSPTLYTEVSAATRSKRRRPATPLASSTPGGGAISKTRSADV